MRKIAIEEHIITKETVNSLAAKKRSPSKDTSRKVLIENIEERLKDMDEDGIDIQVLSSVFHHNELGSPPEVTAKARRSNDALYQVTKKYPGRLAAFAALAAIEPENAAKELERAVKELGFVGTMIFSNIAGEYLDNKKYRVILEKATKLDVPVYVHPSPPPADMIKPFMTYPILAGSMWGYAAETGLHAMRLICSGVFDVYPGLKIILGHLGEAIPLWLWRLDSRWEKETKEIFKDEPFSKLKKKPSQYFKDNFYVTTSGMFWPPALQFVNTALGAERILFAVDYPQESTKEAIKALESTSVSNADKEKIFHLNAEKLLKL